MLGREEEETSAADHGGHASPGGWSWGRGSLCPLSLLLPVASPICRLLSHQPCPPAGHTNGSTAGNHCGPWMLAADVTFSLHGTSPYLRQPASTPLPLHSSDPVKDVLEIPIYRQENRGSERPNNQLNSWVTEVL